MKRASCHMASLRCIRCLKHIYTNPLACRIPICGLRGPLSAVIGPCVDSYSCCIVPVRLTCHWRWDAPMGPKMGDLLLLVDDPQDSPEGEAGPQRTVFGGATPLTNQAKRVLGTKVLMVQTSSNGSEFSNTCMRVPWHVESRFVGSEDHFRP